MDWLEKIGGLKSNAQIRRKLLRISPATIDRLLRENKKKLMFKSRSRTKIGTLLKHQIPIRTFSEWDGQRPGLPRLILWGMTEQMPTVNLHILLTSRMYALAGRKPGGA